MRADASIEAMPALRTLIVDDEPLARSVLRRLIQQHDQLEMVSEARSGLEALDRLAGGGIDLVLLDIQMPELTGLQMLESLESQQGSDPSPSFVFVTAYDRYAVRAFETQAVDYLLKPVTPQRFEKAIAKVQARRRGAKPVQVQQLLADALVTAPTRFLVRRGDHIVPVHDFGKLDDGRSFIAMKLVDGVTLRQRLQDADHNQEALLQELIDLSANTQSIPDE